MFSRGFNPGGTVKETVGQTEIRIVCGGVPVRPGDLVVGNRDGGSWWQKKTSKRCWRAREAIARKEVRVPGGTEAGGRDHRRRSTNSLKFSEAQKARVLQPAQNRCARVLRAGVQNRLSGNRERRAMMEPVITDAMVEEFRQMDTLPVRRQWTGWAFPAGLEGIKPVNPDSARSAAGAFTGALRSLAWDRERRDRGRFFWMM